MSVHLDATKATTAEPWAERAVRLWRQQGVVAFPSLLADAAVDALQGLAHSTLHNDTSPDRSSAIRSSRVGSQRTRTLKALPVSAYHDVLDSLTSTLEPFLSPALGSARLLVLESGALHTASGAVAQEWHRDNVVTDARLAAVQISLHDTTPAAQG